MKLKFQVTGSDETTVRVQVEIITPRYVVRREEAVRLRTKLENRVYEVLRDTGYDVKQIKLQ